MMYVSGETVEPSPETTGMVEEIVRQQVIEMVSFCMIILRYLSLKDRSYGCVRSKQHEEV